MLITRQASLRTCCLFAQHLFQPVRLQNFNLLRGVADQAVFLHLLQLPVKRGPGDVHLQGPLRDGTGNGYACLPRLSVPEKQPECGLLADAVVGEELDLLLQHDGCSRDLCDEILNGYDAIFIPSDWIILLMVKN